MVVDAVTPPATVTTEYIAAAHVPDMSLLSGHDLELHCQVLDRILNRSDKQQKIQHGIQQMWLHGCIKHSYLLTSFVSSVITCLQSRQHLCELSSIFLHKPRKGSTWFTMKGFISMFFPIEIVSN